MQGYRVHPLARHAEPAAWVVERLHRRLDEVAVEGWHGSYLLRMWREALHEARAARSREAPTLGFPYVPVELERLGLDLDQSSSVLDVGCLGGFGMFDFLRRRRRAQLPVPRLVGLDIDRESVLVGRDLAEIWAGDHPVSFHRGSCECLPYAMAAHDLLIARAVLPYVSIEVSMSEFARVLRPGGLALLQVHATGYYMKKIFHHLTRPLKAGYYARAVVSGFLFSMTSYQPGHRWFRETALELGPLIGLGTRHGFDPVWCLPSRNRPLVLLRRRMYDA